MTYLYGGYSLVTKYHGHPGTPPKFNIAREKRWLVLVLVDYFVIGKVTFPGRTVKLWVGIGPTSSHTVVGRNHAHVDK